jgi:hypothetical protein
VGRARIPAQSAFPWTQARPKRQGPFWGKERSSFWKEHKGYGAAYVTRTRDPIITNDVLYQLS